MHAYVHLCTVLPWVICRDLNMEKDLAPLLPDYVTRTSVLHSSSLPLSLFFPSFYCPSSPLPLPLLSPSFSPLPLSSLYQVLAEHSQILHHGLQVEMPSIQETLAGDLQDSTPNQDLQFLTSFIEDKEGTPASRLARYTTIFSNRIFGNYVWSVQCVCIGVFNGFFFCLPVYCCCCCCCCCC